MRKGLLLCVVGVALALSFAPPTLADHNPAGKRLKFEQCTYSDGQEAFETMPDNMCTYDEDGHILDHADRFGEGPNVESALGGFIFLALLWAAIPTFLAINIASSRGQPVAVAGAIGFFGGWLGLAFVYFAMKDAPLISPAPSRTAPENLKNLYSTPEERGAAPAPTVDKSVAGRLRELDGLKEQGLITGEEYENQRKAILSDI